MRTINFSEARSNLKKVLDTVASDHNITIVTRRDSEDAVIMSLADYNALQETLYLFGNPANAARLHAAMAEAEASLPKGARILGPKTGGVAMVGAPVVRATSKSKSVKLRDGDMIVAGSNAIVRSKSSKGTATKVASKATKPAATSKRRA